MLKSSSSVHEADNSRSQLGKPSVWDSLLCIPLISLSFSSFGCFRWFLILFSLGSGRQVKRPSAFQGWLPIIPQLSEGMGTLAALVCSRILVPLIDFPVLGPDCAVSALQVLHASPAAELEFAVKTWHGFGCTPVMGQRLPRHPLQSSKVCFVLNCFRQGTFFAIRVYIYRHYQCIYLWLDTMHGRRKTKRGNESCIRRCSACSGSLL